MKKNLATIVLITVFINVFGQNTDSAFTRVLKLINEQNFNMAIKPLDSLVKKHPEKLNYILQLAFCYRQTNQIDKSINLYKNIISAKPDYATAYFMLANTYMSKKDFSQAIEMMKTAVSIEPDNADFMLLFGQIYNNSGDKKKACKYFKKAKKLGSLEAKLSLKRYCN